MLAVQPDPNLCKLWNSQIVPPSARGSCSCSAPVSKHRRLDSRLRATSLRSSFQGHLIRRDSKDGLRQKEQRARLPVRAIGREVEFDLEGESIAEDYYSILGVRPDATPEEIKKAYYSCMKVCHPDLSGNHPESVAFCQFINEVYEVLSDPGMREVYDDINGYSISGFNPFLDKEAERDHVFVDEFTCIGCKNCANTAERTFEIEELFGRARVMSQIGDAPPLVQEAIDTCPVNCIHWVTAAQLTLLEDEMRRVERVSVGMMLAGMGSRGADVFEQAHKRWLRRRSQAQAVARARMMKEKGKTFNQWGDMWQGAAEAGADGEEEEGGRAATERPARRYDASKMARAASAARRWRDFSRSGLDRRARRVIAAASELQQQEEETAV